MVGLRRKVEELMNQKDALLEDMQEQKKATKVCVFNELDAQLEVYADECKRLRAQLEASVRKQIAMERAMRRI